MTNHVHLVVVPERTDSLAVLLRRVHRRHVFPENRRSVPQSVPAFWHLARGFPRTIERRRPPAARSLGRQA